MDMLFSLWLPILLAAAAAWFWSFLSWAALGLHKPESRAFPEEDRALDAIRALKLPPGNYFFPWMEHGSRDPKVMEKWHAGPAGKLSIWTPNISMPANMLATFMVNLVAAFLMAYVASVALPAGAPFARVFQVLGTMGVAVYSLSFLPNMIWFQGGRRAMVMGVLDGVVQGLAGGAIFAAMWPK